MNPPVMDGLIVLMAVSIWACIFHFMSFKFEYMLLTTVHLTTQKKKKHSPKSSDPNGTTNLVILKPNRLSFVVFISHLILILFR